MPPAPHSQSSTIAGPAGRLEILVESTAGPAPTGCAVVCHPHPLHGGTLQNKVAHTLARSFVASGFVALRFNFRGVGASEGDYDGGVGETDDVLAAADWLAGEHPGLPLWLSGFSFGAAMAVQAAVRREPAGLVSIAPAVSRFIGHMAHQPQCPWLIVQGDRDELVDVDETIAWVNSLEPGPELVVLEDTVHFFHGRLVQLRQVVEAFVAGESGPEPGA